LQQLSLSVAYDFGAVESAIAFTNFWHNSYSLIGLSSNMKAMWHRPTSMTQWLC